MGLGDVTGGGHAVGADVTGWGMTPQRGGRCRRTLRPSWGPEEFPGLAGSSVGSGRGRDLGSLSTSHKDLTFKTLRVMPVTHKILNSF